VGERLRILVVDDDADIRTIARLSLGLDAEIEVETAGTPGRALAMIAEGAGTDAILLDVMMPEMDGPALAAEVRQLPGRAATPILFMTARARPADIERYHTLGAAGVITKPFDPLELAGAVRAAIGRPRAAGDLSLPRRGG
jgi:two-component system OmpR family response regulator